MKTFEEYCESKGWSSSSMCDFDRHWSKTIWDYRQTEIDELQKCWEARQHEIIELKSRLQECEHILNFVDLEWSSQIKMREKYFNKWGGK